MRAALILALLGLALPAFACCTTDLRDPSTSVRVIAAKVVTTKSEGAVVVSVLGELQNTTEATVDDLVVEARLLDSKGEQVDTLTQSLYGLKILPLGKLAFRLQGTAAAASDAYVSVSARVTSGVAQAPSPMRSASEKGENVIVSFLVSWGPMLLLVLVWIVLARKYSGKGSPQQRLVQLMEEQNVLFSKQVAALEALQQAARQPPRGDA